MAKMLRVLGYLSSSCCLKGENATALAMSKRAVKPVLIFDAPGAMMIIMVMTE
jgi:hypothetical protein